MQNEEGREKLKEVWEYLEKIEKANQEIEKKEAEIEQLDASLALAEQRRDAAVSIIEALEKVSGDRDKARQRAATQLNQKKSEIAKLVAELTEATKQAGDSAKSVGALLRQAEGRLDRARTDLNTAKGLAPSSKEAQIISAVADVEASVGRNYLELVFLRSTLQQFTARTDDVWSNLYTGKPAKPASSDIQAFMANTEDALELASTSYAKAVELQKQAVRAADRDAAWTYKRELAALYLAYAEVLRMTGESAQADGQIASAKQAITEAISAAPASQAETMRILQSEIEGR
jgi:chromosome segregation ATPase